MPSDGRLRLQSIQTEYKVLAALLGALEGSNKPLVMTSGTALLKGEKDIPESTTPDLSGGRGKAEHIAIEASPFLYAKNGNRQLTLHLGWNTACSGKTTLHRCISAHKALSV